MSKTIFAYTPADIAVPPYFNITDHENDLISVSVRTEGAGYASFLHVPIDELLKMAAAVNTHCFPLQRRS